MTTPTNREQEKDGGGGLEPDIACDHCMTTHPRLNPSCCEEYNKLNDELARYQAQAPAIEAVVEAARPFRPGPHIEHAFYTHEQACLDAALAALDASKTEKGE